MARSARFWNIIAKRYSKQPVANEEAYQKKLKKTQEYFSSDMEVLEFGCGTGSTAIVHSPFVKHILAIDFSPKMLSIAQEKIDAKKITNIRLECNTIEEVIIQEESKHVVMGHSILHLLKDKEAVIAKVRKMLKPGGLFITSTVCLGNRYTLERLILSIGNFFGLLPLVRFFSPSELVKSITQAGFRIDYQWQPGNDQVVFIVAVKNSH